MPSPIYRYPLDLTGRNLNNLVVDELHTLNNLAKRAIIPKYSPYFSESLVVRDAISMTVLQKGVHYDCLQLNDEVTIKTGKEICEVILITDSDVSNQVYITYQVVGGLYQRTTDAILDLYNTVMNDNRPVDWANVSNKPYEYPPSLHNHLYRDIIGYEPLIAMLERIRIAILLGNTSALQAVIDYINRIRDQLGIDMSDLRDELIEYIDNKTVAEVIMIKPNSVMIPRNSTLHVDLEAVNVVGPYIYHWSIEHLTTNSSDFGVTNGTLNLRTGFTDIDIHIKDPKVNRPLGTFKLNIHLENLAGKVIFKSGVWTLEEFKLPQVDDLLFSRGKCILDPDIYIDAMTLFVLGRCGN